MAVFWGSKVSNLSGSESRRLRTFQVREILADFAVGQRCEGFEVSRLLKKKKDLPTTLRIALWLE